ncbi:response regulator [Maribacter sp. 2304DJ31-5]|uniref:response regulator n=1 Tax=Maribacter sp. 2304DJ31-5 TaxID=3386273 RepID=UPI0039BC3955
MKEKIKLLILEDQPMLCRAYRMFLQNDHEMDFCITEAHNCKEGYALIAQATIGYFDLVLLDVQMPAYPEKGITSGEDLGLLLRKRHSRTKIIIVTYLMDGHRLYRLFKNINPDGILIKSDMDEDFIIDTIKMVLQGNMVYSPAFHKLLQNRTGNCLLDETDWELLHLLSIGMPVKELSKKMNLSLSSIEKRKRKLKEFFLNDKDQWFNERSLLHIARERGFI